MAASAPEKDSGIRAVSRALTVLGVFTAERMTATLADLVRETGLPRTTVLRLVETLVADGMLETGADGLVRVGTRLIGWATFAEAAWSSPEATAARLRAVAAATGETVSIYVRTGSHRVVVAQAPSHHVLRTVVQVGDELPLTVGAAAMVLLGLEPEVRRDALIAEIAARPESRADAATIRGRVADAREQGWAVSNGLREAGNTGLAVPIPRIPGARNPARPAVLALGGPTARFTAERIPGFVTELQAAARDVAASGLPPALY